MNQSHSVIASNIKFVEEIEHLNIEITRGCNQRCFYCFNDSGDCLKNELPLRTWLTILKQLKLKGLKSVLVTGGEPFTRLGIMDFLKKVQDLGIETSILSNGYKVQEYAITCESVFKNIVVAQISLDSMNPETHDKRRGEPGAWKQAIDAIQSLKNLGVSIEISCVTSEDNLSNVYALVEYCRAIGALLILRPLTAIGRGSSCIRHSKNAILANKIKQLEKKYDKIITGDRFQYVPQPDLHNNRIDGIVTMTPTASYQFNSKGYSGNKFYDDAISSVDVA